jgi:hypothetical protein
MKSDAASGGGVGWGGRRRGLLLFALLLVLAQVVLFAFLRLGRSDDRAVEARPTIPSAGASQRPPATTAPAPAVPLPATGSLASRIAPAPGPEKQPLRGTDNPSVTGPQKSAVADGDGDEDAAKDRAARREREKHERERIDRERERRERIQIERERERERERLEAERDRARLEAEKDRARLETERAEKARAEAERERARLEAERARLLAERSTAAQDGPSVAARPAGSPDVLVVLISARAGARGISREEIRNIYHGRTTFWPNNTPVLAYSRPAGSPAGRKFFRSILGTSASAFREHWNGLQLSGGGIAPSTISSAESVVARVAGASGAIGYVLESELPAETPGVRLVRFP